MTHLPNISLVHFGSFLIGEISWGGAGGKTSPQHSPDLLWLLAFGLWQAAPSFFPLFASALALFRKHRRLLVVNQNVFIFFSEAKRFLIISSSQMACTHIYIFRAYIK